MVIFVFYSCTYKMLFWKVAFMLFFLTWDFFPQRSPHTIRGSERWLFSQPGHYQVWSFQVHDQVFLPYTHKVSNSCPNSQSWESTILTQISRSLISFLLMRTLIPQRKFSLVRWLIFIVNMTGFKTILEGQQDYSVGKGACPQSWRPDDLSLIPGTHIKVHEKNWLHKVVFRPPPLVC